MRTHLVPQQIVDQLGVHIDTVLSWIHQNQLKASNIASGSRPRWRIAKTDLAAFLDSRSNQQQATTKPVRRRRAKPVKGYV